MRTTSHKLQRPGNAAPRSLTGIARRTTPPGLQVVGAVNGSDILPGELFQQLSTTGEETWKQLEPHFGSKIASQLLQQATSATQSAAQSATASLPSVALPTGVELPPVSLPALPDFSNIHAPQVQLPSVQLPAVDLHNVAVPDSNVVLQAFSQSAGAAADGLAQLPANLQQQLQILQLQVQELSMGSSSSSLEPHFGSKAVASLLQQLVEGLTSAMQQHLPVLQVPVLPPASSFSSQSQMLLSGGSSSGIDPSMFFYNSGGSAAAAAASALKASWHVLQAAGQQALPAGATEPLRQGAAAVANWQESASTATLASGLQLQQALLELQTQLLQLQQHGMGGYSFPTLCFVAAGAIAAIAASVPADGSGVDSIKDELTHDYDPDKVAAYFKRRPVLVAQRSMQLAAEIAGFGINILGDLWSNRVKANEAMRAEQLRCVIERLGPAYVKVAQALSTRVDLLPPEYYKQVQLLQDRVPPFPCEQAKQVMAAAFKRPVEEVFVSLSSTPVAAASLGQVYKGTLRPEFGGDQVAVKVQRPGVLEQVCLDLYLMRQAAEAISSMPDVRTDWASLIDNWAVRFLHEMDYTREAANAALFRSQMSAAGVTGVVTADVYEQLSDDVVLTTAWVDGEKLSESRAADVRELCNTLLSAYLIQLLDTGLLHADPHPGNLIRTADGKICVLDFGLMTEVTAEQRIALVEYISHLTTQDWENVARDLQTLGFIPADAGDPVAMGMAEPLGKILVQLSGGGGATKLNIDAVMAELEELGSSYPFSIPPFFALILRAFSVIEGIALAVDPDYSIVQECFPYLARRLLSDDDPRVHKALRDVLYGNKSRLDVDRLIRLSDAFSSYTTDGLLEVEAVETVVVKTSPRTSPTTSPVPAAASAPSASPALSPAAKDALLAVFSKKGSYVQQLLVEELVVATDALSREALSETLRLLLGSAPVALAMSSLEALGPLRPLLLPFTTPLEVLSRLAPAVAVTPEDEEALAVVRGIFQLVQQMGSSGSASTNGSMVPGSMVFSTTAGQAGLLAGPRFGATVPMDGRTAIAAAAEAVSDAAEVARELQPLLPELLPGLTHTGELFVRAFTQRVATRLAESLSAGSGNSDADEAERAMAMAALSFIQTGGVEGTGILGRGLGNRSSTAAPMMFSTTPMPANSLFSSTSSIGAGASGRSSGNVRDQRQQPHIPGFGPAPQPFGNASSRLPSATPGGITAGQLVTGLVAAPLLVMLTPLAVLNEMQRRHRQGPQ